MSSNKYPLSLSQQAYSATQVLQNEVVVAKKLNIEMQVLMERAGNAAFEQIMHSWPNIKSILVVCGKGNNGGDGFVIARCAHLAGLDVSVLSLNDKLAQGNAGVAYQALQDAGVNIIKKNDSLVHGPEQVITSFSGELIVDSIFGIGFHGQLNEEMTILIDAINQHSAKKLSIDIPSGLLASSGQVESIAVMADVTITFIVLKRGLLTAMAANYIGELFLDDLNIGPDFIVDAGHQGSIHSQGTDDLPKLTKRLPTSHKGNIGLLLAIGGNIGMPGAIRLSGEAALRCGAALLAISCHQDNQVLVFATRPEMMLAATNAEELNRSTVLNKAKVLIIGPGLGRDNWAKQMFNLTILQKKTCVIDADALYFLSNSKAYNSQWVLTPHPKEAAILLNCTVDEIEADRFNTVKKIAKKYGGICLLKGAGSLISNGQDIWLNSTGNAGMASGGMGDVLSGIIAALLLQMPDAFKAVRLACYIHGAAADRIADKNGQRGMLASDLFAELQHLVNEYQ
jgi:NAD(P)H-hydrate epimerase